MEIHLITICRNILPSFPVFAVLPIALFAYARSNRNGIDERASLHPC